MFGAGNSETVTVIRSAGRTRVGDPIPGGTTFDVAGCLFAPGPSQEPAVAAQQVDTDATVYAPPGTAVLPTDRIRARGVEYAVVGDPQDWAGYGVVIVLRRVTG